MSDAFEEATALADNLPEISSETQFQLALFLLEELELDIHDVAALEEMIERRGP